MAQTNLGPCFLEGRFVKLEPLRRNHADALSVAAEKLDFGWALTPLLSRNDVDKRIDDTLELEKKNQGYAFAVLLKQENRIVGSTSYFGIVPEHKRLEIGYTWYEQTLWGSFVNPESKYLLLRHAFEDWHAIRVQISTDVKNVHSQRAIVKLGAKFEGTLRNHAVRRDGSLRDTMMYSITSDDWPQVKKTLEERISRFSK
jgi:RimJ/RimL family protein N-acetyltransferase